MHTTRIAPFAARSTEVLVRLGVLAVAAALATLPIAARAADGTAPAGKPAATATSPVAPGQSRSADEAPHPSDKMTGRSGSSSSSAVDAQPPSSSDKVQGTPGAAADATAGVRPGPASSSTADPAGAKAKGTAPKSKTHGKAAPHTSTSAVSSGTGGATGSAK